MNITDKIQITNEDNMALMARYPDNYFDLAIVDPPYGINAAKEKFTPLNDKWIGKKKVGYVSKDWDKEIPSDEYFNELFRVSKNQIIWGGNYFGLIGGYIFWDKGETMPTYSKGELAWCSFMNKVDKFEYLWSGFKKKHQIERIHPTQKPTDLYRYCLTNYAKQGDKILDTHLGSGSIAIACHDYGFDLTACELDKEYYDKSIERIINHTNQTKLF